MSAESALDLISSLHLDNGKTFGEVAEPWQLDSCRTIFDPKAPPYRWESRPRGGGKTSDAALWCIGLMAELLPPGSRLYCVAVDRDQARLVTDALAGYVARTPALAGAFDVGAYRVTHKSGSALEVLASDASSAWGIKPSAVVIDEICQHPSTSNAKTLYQAIQSSLGKIKGAKLVVISTSGDPAHWSRKIYENALKSKMWTVQDVPGPLSWMSPEYLEEQRASLPESVYTRLFRNSWCASEDRLTSAEDLDACISLDGWQEPQARHRYFIGVDIGLKNDRTAISVCHAEPLPDGNGNRVCLDRMEVFSGTPQNPVDLDTVQEWLEETAKRYRARIIIDPYQAAALQSRLRKRGVQIDEFVFSQTSVGRLAVALHTSIREHRLALPNDEPLLDELRNVRLKATTTPNVYRLDHDNSRHDDRAISLALCVLALAEIKSSGARDWLESLAPLCACGTPNTKGSTQCSKCGEPIAPVAEQPQAAQAETPRNGPWGPFSPFADRAPDPTTVNALQMVEQIRQAGWFRN